MFNFTASAVKGAKGKVEGPSVRVSQKTLDQVAKTSVNQAAIIITGVEAGKAGVLKITLGDQVYYLSKKANEFNLHPKHQGEHLAEYGDLFNKLAATPDVTVSCTIE